MNIRKPSWCFAQGRLSNNPWDVRLFGPKTVVLHANLVEKLRVVRHRGDVYKKCRWTP